MTTDYGTPTQARKKYTGFQTRFLFVLATILIIFSGITVSIIYHHEMKNLEENAFEKTELIMNSIEANRDYVQDVLRPTMYRELGDKRFILEAMSSSYISRMIMENFNKKAHGFIYRRVAINAKNPEYEANPLEADMIKRFRKDPQMAEWQGIIEIASRKYFMRFQPVVFKESCLSCHGKPEDAPEEVTKLYGKTRGYFHEAEKISGVIGVGMPIDLNLERIKKFAIALFAGVVPSIFIVFVIISTFFNRYIAGNLRTILSFFRTNIKDDEGRSIFENSQAMDEIDELTATARTIAEHIHLSQNTLEKYADEILKSKNLLQSVFDGITDPVVLMDRKGKIKVVNKAFRQRYNLSMDQIIDRRPAEFLNRDCCPLACCEDIFVSLPEHPISREIQMAGGEIFLIYIYPIRVDGRETESVVCYVKDITEQKKMETKIQQTEKIASIGQLAAGIAHEINNPLTGISNAVQILQKAGTDETKRREIFDLILTNIGRITRIIDDLRVFSRQERFEGNHFDLVPLIEETLKLLRYQRENDKIEIQFLHANPSCSLRGSKNQFQQLLVNLLLNSSQAITGAGQITVELARIETPVPSAVIKVSDSGCGIPEDQLEQIFDPFFTTKRDWHGTGLGLAVSHRIVQLFKGAIMVTSKVGEGTTFTITLPLETQEENPGIKKN